MQYLNNIKSKNAVFFAGNILESPENTLYSFFEFINNEVSLNCLESILFSFSFNLNLSFYETPQKLVVIYFIEKIENEFKISSYSVGQNSEFLAIKQLHENEMLLVNQLNLKNLSLTVSYNQKFFSDCFIIFMEESKQSLHIQSEEAFLFEPVFIKKPWGQEIWYTGAEKRGISCVKPFGGKFSRPLSEIFSILPSTLKGECYKDKDLILIKILDPYPQEVYGDLYFELHTIKNEVYVVTEVASEGPGKIKIGANSEKLQQFESHQEYKKAFLESIKDYELVRRKIDTLIDTFRLAEGYTLTEPVEIQKMKIWEKKLPPELLAEEQEKRQNMDSFAGLLELNIGDVVNVPIRVPHALQHGVKVIEFQTPTYERLIVSFAQKVLTQNHWDTQEAFSLMNLVPPVKKDLKILSNNNDCCVEEVCYFEDFYSTKTKLEAQKTVNLKETSFYKILFLVTGKISLINKYNQSVQVEPSQCVFLPANCEFKIISTEYSIYLLSSPEFF